MVEPQAAELAMRRLHNKPIVRKQQSGAVLILVAFLMALAFSLFVLKSLNSQDLTVLKQQKNAQALGEAKKALIAWAVAHPNHPGQMPFPDRNSDANYDGLADCSSPLSTFSYGFLIGQLPVSGQLNPCEQPQDLALASGLLDAEGNPLWYAVSRNLIHKYEITAPCNVGFYTCQANQTGDPIINPAMMNAPLYPWMRVLDRNGNVISSRVAAVIIAPGLPLSNQNRSVATPNANQFLDSVSIGGTVFSNADYAAADEDFVMGQNGRNVNASDITVTQPYFFNDQLVYITIDELMPMLTKRAAAETSRLLRSYLAGTGQFPWAANLGQVLHNHFGNAPNQMGMLPVDVTDTCSCASASSCSCPFGLLQSIELRRTSGTWNSTQSTGACMVSGSGQICSCLGAGSCRRFTTNFTCDGLGNCTSLNLTGVNTWTFTTKQHLDIFSTPAKRKCLPTWPVTSPSQQPCNLLSIRTDGTFDRPFTTPIIVDNFTFPLNVANDNGITIGLREAYWFKENFWQDFFYYQWSVTPTLQVGGRTGVSAILVGTGAPLVSELGTNQTRPSSLITDYLDSAENADFDLVFDGLNKPASNTYNDIPFIVAP
jgi:hypothetical protein